MPTLQSPGIGSGLDVNSIVQQLVAAEKAPGASRIAREKTAVATEVSALGSLKGALAAFKATLDPIKTLESFAVRTATSSDDDVFTASAKAGAATGSYSIQVSALAQAQQLSSTVFAGGSTTVVGTGTLAVSLGSTTFNVVIDSSNSTLAGIRDAINRTSGNPGVRATIINESGGAHLVLTSAKTGLTNTIKLTTDSTNGLQNLSYDAPSDTAHYTVLKPPLDATILVAGFTRTSASNTITDAIDGVTITLKSADLGVSKTLTVEENLTAATTRVQNFISQYNAAYTQLQDLGKYDASTGKGGPLLGDALLRSINTEFRGGVADPVSGLTGDYKMLADLGITTTKQGTLELNDNKLSLALATNFDGVAAVFGSANGVAARLSTSIAKRLEVTADIAVRNLNLDKRTKNVQVDQNALDLRMARVEDRLRKQFSALDGVLSKLQSTSSFLTQQLQAINNSNR